MDPKRLVRALYFATRQWLKQESSYEHRCYVTPDGNGVVLEYDDPDSIDHASGTIEVITIAVTRCRVRVRDGMSGAANVGSLHPRDEERR